MNTGTTNPNRLLRLDKSVYDQFAPASDHADTVRLVGRHIEAHLGPVKQIAREKNTHGLPMDIQITPPAPTMNYYTLVTSGMSDKPMSTPTNLHQYRFAELYTRMPANWNYGSGEPDFDTWPIDLLLKLARLPHTTASWLGYGHNIPCDGLVPYPSPTAFTGILLTSALVEHEHFQTLQVSPAKRIYFYNVCPLYADELELVQLTGPTYMEDLLISQGLTGAFDVHRQSVLAPVNPTSQTPPSLTWVEIENRDEQSRYHGEKINEKQKC